MFRDPSAQGRRSGRVQDYAVPGVRQEGSVPFGEQFAERVQDAVEQRRVDAEVRGAVVFGGGSSDVGDDLVPPPPDGRQALEGGTVLHAFVGEFRVLAADVEALAAGAGKAGGPGEGLLGLFRAGERTGDVSGPGAAGFAA